jgi:aminomethyltransferase
LADSAQAASLQRTPLHSLHQRLQARLVPFAGYEMPVQYPTGIVAEHLHTRDAAGLFDVSHMGQAILTGRDHDSVARAIEKLVPADILGLEPGQIRYSQLTNSEGGIIDDLMITRPNAGTATAGSCWWSTPRARLWTTTGYAATSPRA